MCMVLLSPRTSP